MDLWDLWDLWSLWNVRSLWGLPSPWNFWNLWNLNKIQDFWTSEASATSGSFLQSVLEALEALESLETLGPLESPENLSERLGIRGDLQAQWKRMSKHIIDAEPRGDEGVMMNIDKTNKAIGRPLVGQGVSDHVSEDLPLYYVLNPPLHPSLGAPSRCP